MVKEKDKSQGDYKGIMGLLGFIIFAISLAFVLGMIPSKIPVEYIPYFVKFGESIDSFNLTILRIIAIVLSLIAAEWFYIKKSKKLIIKKGEDKNVVLVGRKIGALIVGPFIATFFILLIFLSWVVLEVFATLAFYDWLQILIAFSITWIVLLIIWLNVEFVGSKYARDETEGEYKARMKKEKEEEEEEERGDRKFKIGDKVKVRKWGTYITNVPEKKRWAGRIVTIDDYCDDEDYVIVEDKGKWKWDDYQLEKIKQNDKSLKKLKKKSLKKKKGKQ